MRLLVLAALAGAVLFAWPRTEKGAAVLDMTLPRGVRLNNPGNIRHGDNWRGMAPDQPDQSFVYFTDPRYGIRAMVKILQSYRRRGIRTVRDIINTWAPPIENNTAAYVESVAGRMGVSPDAPIDLENTGQVIELLQAITLHENGQQPYNRATFEQGVELA